MRIAVLNIPFSVVLFALQVCTNERIIEQGDDGDNFYIVDRYCNGQGDGGLQGGLKSI